MTGQERTDVSLESLAHEKLRRPAVLRVEEVEAGVVGGEASLRQGEGFPQCQAGGGRLVLWGVRQGGGGVPT